MISGVSLSLCLHMHPTAYIHSNAASKMYKKKTGKGIYENKNAAVLHTYDSLIISMEIICHCAEKIVCLTLLDHVFW